MLELQRWLVKIPLDQRAVAFAAFEVRRTASRELRDENRRPSSFSQSPVDSSHDQP
jgi:hypothetical protein